MRAFQAVMMCTALLLAGRADAGVVSPLYVTQYAGNSGAILQGNSVIGTFTTGVSTETGIAVRDTVRIINGFGNDGAGSEYDLNGNVINPGIYLNTTFVSLYDGTTDGQYNYAIDHNGNGFDGVFRFDLNWSNPELLFNTTQRSSGITYDSRTNTLWTTEGAGAPTGAFRQYSMSGTQLSSFANTTGGSSYAIAYDAADDTLWVSRYTTNTLYQYDKLGNLLDSTDFGGDLHQNPFGMEFQLNGANVVPEPSSIALLGLGGLGLMVARRRRQSA